MLLNMPMLLIISGCNVKYAEDAANSLFGSMMLAAEKHGLSSCWLSGASDVDVNSEEAQKLMHEVKNILQIPGEYVPLCIGAFGYNTFCNRLTAVLIVFIKGIKRVEKFFLRRLFFR